MSQRKRNQIIDAIYSLLAAGYIAHAVHGGDDDYDSLPWELVESGLHIEGREFHAPNVDMGIGPWSE